MSSVECDAHAVLLPAFDTLTLDDSVVEHLRGGGKSILLGESRGEYVSRRMTEERMARETIEAVRSVVDQAAALAGTLVVAVDQELAGIQRLAGLAPRLPSLEAAMQMTDADLASASETVARAAKAMGINLFLSPILDVVTGTNAWLSGRTLGTDANQVARIGAAFIRGIQAGGVAATAKHFPGYPMIDADPAIFDSSYPGPVSDRALQPFRAAIAAGVHAVMTGPAIIEVLDPVNAASTSPAVMRLLRRELGFSGLIISDDLDAKATLKDNTIGQTAVAALDAGAELLLLAAGPHLSEVVYTIVEAVESGRLGGGKLAAAAAAAKVRAIANTLAGPQGSAAAGSSRGLPEIAANV